MASLVQSLFTETFLHYPGISSEALPTRLKSVLVDLFEAPPSFNTAMLLVEKVAKEHWHCIDDAIRLVVASDGITHKRERQFLSAWDTVRAA